MSPQPMFTPLASVDVENAHQWYEAQRPGLGDGFRAALAVACQVISKFPESGPTAHGGIRRILLPRFPLASSPGLGTGESPHGRVAIDSIASSRQTTNTVGGSRLTA